MRIPVYFLLTSEGIAGLVIHSVTTDSGLILYLEPAYKGSFKKLMKNELEGGVHKKKLNPSICKKVGPTGDHHTQ